MQVWMNGKCLFGLWIQVPISYLVYIYSEVVGINAANHQSKLAMVVAAVGELGDLMAVCVEADVVAFHVNPHDVGLVRTSYD